MARQIRIEYPGAIYHITSQGNAQQPIFETKADRYHFLSILERVVNAINGAFMLNGLIAPVKKSDRVIYFKDVLKGS